MVLDIIKTRRADKNLSCSHWLIYTCKKTQGEAYTGRTVATAIFKLLLVLPSHTIVKRGSFGKADEVGAIC